MFDDSNKPLSHLSDPYAAKANFDVNEKRLHSQGAPGLLYQVTNLLILVGIIAVIIVLVRIF
ncbi:hypothetical protein EJP82_19195 [Paenibacillus anaericanus]|uniref:Uncharacterized protein n=1 Tax=Paenibacillus anaericanus TaxID=170367 RepID=A0A3S1DNV8_9BACL|nr:hypothetical protein [Paenibacillus anaericanus]RUT43825.1 hypothetical protein EJP82_19195 [Paenibacillus anaericanus]